MAAFDQTMHVAAPPNIVWQEALGFARKGRVVREDAHRFLVATQLKHAFAYLLDQQADGTTRLRHVIDRESRVEQALQDHPDPASALNALTSGEASPAQEALGSALGALGEALRADMPGMSSMLQGEERLKKIKEKAERAAQQANWMPAPAPIEPSPAVEPPHLATPAEMASLATSATSDVIPPTGKPPWDPKLFTAMAFLFSFGASGILAGLNWRRLGKPRLALPTIVISLIGLAGFLALVMRLAENQATLIGYVANLGIGALLTYWQLPAYRQWIATHGQTASRKGDGLIPVVVGLGVTGVILAVAFVPPLLQGNAAVQHFDRGNVHLAQEQYASAVEEYTQVIAIDSERVEAYVNRGLAYLRQGQYDLAIADCGKAIALDPKALAAFYNRGLAYLQQDQYDLAIADFDKAIALDPKSPDVYRNRGMAYALKGDADRAMTDLEQAVALNPKDAVGFFLCGALHFDRGEREEAAADFNTALELGLPAEVQQQAEDMLKQLQD